MPSYSEYLEIEKLLSLQRTADEGDEHDEMLFIVIHQVYELWFKETLHEVDYLKGLLESGDLPRSQHTIKRMLTVLKIMVAQIDILETMTPLEFLTFRERLESGSGFQSCQFRELEFVLGYKRPDVIERMTAGDERSRLEKRYRDPTLWDAFMRYLSARYPVPQSVLERDVTERIEPSEEIQAILIDIYRNDSRNAEFCERLVDYDEGLQEWRYRHVKMVERTIGTKPGTGGSSGASYLQTTLNHPLFPDLWAVRTHF